MPRWNRNPQSLTVDAVGGVLRDIRLPVVQGPSCASKEARGRAPMPRHNRRIGSGEPGKEVER